MRLRGEDELRRISDLAMRAAQADQVEVMVVNGSSALTRFANNYIHQNVEETDTSVRVRAVLGKKIGVAATDLVDDAGLKAVAERAVKLARLQQDNLDFVSLPGPTPISSIDGFDSMTADFGPEQRARVVGDVVAAARERNLTAAGAFQTGYAEIAVANSLGTWAYEKQASADINSVVMGETSSGFVEGLSLDANRFEGSSLAAEAINKCLRGANPRNLEPGEYDVVLQEYAVSDFMDYFAYLSFGARAFLEERSFMSGSIGKPVMGENISIWDDGLSLDGLPSLFDAEGVAKQRVNFISNGVAQDVVWDSYYGAKTGRSSTGHALPAGETFGPAPGNMFMAPGSSTIDEMIASMKRGIFVSRFWYTRPVHPLTVVMTGMTRDGTFLIENGRIVAPVRNLRFTQSYLEAMNRVDLIGNETRLLPMAFGCCRVPALKIRGWNFTGVTES